MEADQEGSFEYFPSRPSCDSFVQKWLRPLRSHSIQQNCIETLALVLSGVYIFYFTPKYSCRDVPSSSSLIGCSSFLCILQQSFDVHKNDSKQATVAFINDVLCFQESILVSFLNLVSIIGNRRDNKILPYKILNLLKIHVMSLFPGKGSARVESHTRSSVQS